MRLAILAAIALGCGSHPPAHPAPPPAASAFPATRWVPAHPTYVLASATVTDAQRSLRDVIDSLGMLAGIDLGDVSRGLHAALAVDPLSPDQVAEIGVDLNGGIAMFSEDVSPTFVLHLASSDQLQAFFDRQRARGLRTQSVVVDGIEIVTAQLVVDMKVSWAIADDWLWVHFSLPFTHDDPTAWFTGRHRPAAPGWAQDWQWALDAAGKAKPTLVGFVNARDVIGSLASRVPDAVACAKLVSPIGRVGLSIDGDGHAVAGKLTIDVGPAAQSLTAALLPVPAGWAAATTKAPLAVQWNLDLVAMRGWLAPCAKAIGEDLGWLDKYGVRAARAMILSFDPGEKSGSGAVAIDLAHKTWFAARLDDLPGGSLRSTLERDRNYGPLAGHSLSIPFGPTIDYVLGDRVAFVAVGDHLLADLVGSGKGAPGPLAAIDVLPPAMDGGAWEWILEKVVGWRAKSFVQRLMRWHDGHIAVTVSGASIVVAASGTRR
jgi:hypothetical protein